jgi:hypothetical protein
MVWCSVEKQAQDFTFTFTFMKVLLLMVEYKGGPD